MTINAGYVKIHRSLTEWEWYGDINTSRVFLHLLLTVNYKDQKWRGTVIKRGQRVVSLSALAEETNLSIQNVRTAIKHLKLTGELTDELIQYGSLSFRLITVNNYGKYQDVPQEVTGEPTGDQQATNRRPTATKEGKKERNNIYTPLYACAREENAFCEQSGKAEGKAFGEFQNVILTDDEYVKLCEQLGKAETDEYISKVSLYMESSGKKYKNYYATIKNWKRKDNAAPGKADRTKPKKQNGFDIDRKSSYDIGKIKSKFNNFEEEEKC